MDKFYTIFGVVLLGVFSLGMEAEVKSILDVEDIDASNILHELQMRNKMRSYYGGFETGSGKKVADSDNGGLAKILTQNLGLKYFICSGIHLKPWIVLTTATCVKSINARNLFVEMTYWDWENTLTKTLNVSEVIIDPSYNVTTRENDRALLIVYADIFSIVHGFILPVFNPSPDFVSKTKLTTYEKRWKYDSSIKDFVTYTVQVNVTLDYTICGEDVPVHGWYCAEILEKPEKFNETDVGIPIYFDNFGIKTVIGLYNGRNVNKTNLARMFEPVWPGSFWLLEQLVKHLLPPRS